MAKKKSNAFLEQFGPYQEGVTARKNGEHYNDNPYMYSEHEQNSSNLWKLGYDSIDK